VRAVMMLVTQHGSCAVHIAATPRGSRKPPLRCALCCTCFVQSQSAAGLAGPVGAVRALNMRLVLRIYSSEGLPFLRVLQFYLHTCLLSRTGRSSWGDASAPSSSSSCSAPTAPRAFYLLQCMNLVEFLSFPAPQDWQIPLGRRFRALKLWFVLRTYGAEGLRSYVSHHMRLAAHFADLVRGDERFELMAPPRFGLVCFRVKVTTVRYGIVDIDEENAGNASCKLLTPAQLSCLLPPKVRWHTWFGLAIEP